MGTPVVDKPYAGHSESMSLLLSKEDYASNLLPKEEIFTWIEILGLFAAIIGAVMTLIAMVQRTPRNHLEFLESMVFPDRYRSVLIVGAVLLFSGLILLVVKPMLVVTGL